MNVLMRAGPIVGRPIVTLGGDDVAQVRDVLFSHDEGRLLGFTLAKRGLFGGRLRGMLRWADVHALGPDALMIRDAAAFGDEDTGEGTPDGDVLADHVITDAGVDLGTVTDVVLEVNDEATVVGYELEASPALEERQGRRLFVPRPDTIAVSRDALVVPASAVDYVRDDLAGFGEAVESFRSRLREQ